MTLKLKNGGDSGGLLYRKLLKLKHFATVEVYKSLVKGTQYHIVPYYVWMNKTSQKF